MAREENWNLKKGRETNGQEKQGRRMSVGLLGKKKIKTATINRINRKDKMMRRERKNNGMKVRIQSLSFA